LIYLQYFVRRALRGIAETPFVNAVATLTIGIALFVVLIAGGLVSQLQGLLGDLAQDLTVNVYLEPNISAPTLAEVEGRIRAALGEEAQIERVEPDAALARLRSGLGDNAGILDGLLHNPLPLTLVVRSPQLADLVLGSGLSESLSELPGVESVDDGREWADRLHGVVSLAALLGKILGGLILLAAAVMVSNTIKLAVFARRDEIAIMKLCGGTDAFVRAPFLIEGLLQGLAGAALAGLAATLLWVFMMPQLTTLLEEAFAVSFRPAAPWQVLVWLELGGGVLGLAGSALSVGRFLKV